MATVDDMQDFAHREHSDSCSVTENGLCSCGGPGSGLRDPAGIYRRALAAASPEVRTFPTGATRDSDLGKLDYEGFLSPLAIQRFAEYMHKHREQSDGTLRASDNWQKGIPTEQYMKSMFRHFMETWGLHRGVEIAARPEEGPATDMIEALCALWFNVQGALHELLKSQREETS